MTNAYQRGVILGGQLARNQPCMLIADVPALARFILAWAIQQGYAHLEPHNEFIAGFVHGFETAHVYVVNMSQSVTAA